MNKERFYALKIIVEKIVLVYTFSGIALTLLSIFLVDKLI